MRGDALRYKTYQNLLLGGNLNLRKPESLTNKRLVKVSMGGCQLPELERKK